MESRILEVEPAALVDEVMLFKLRGVSALPHGVGERIMTPRFELFGRGWCVQINLGGETQESAGFVSLFLRPDPPADSAVAIHLGFAIFAGPSAEPDSLVWSEQTTPIVRSGWGWSKTILREVLVRRCSEDDVALIRLTIRAPDRSPVSFRYDTLDTPPQSTVLRDLASLLESGAGSDVVIRCGSTDFRAHRWMLCARSSVMKAMFAENRFKEGSPASSSEPVVVKDIEPDTMRQLLSYLYSGSVASSVASFGQWVSLLFASDRFDVKDLFALAEHRIARLLTSKNAVECLAIASRLPSATRLKNSTLDFLSRTRVTVEELRKLDSELLVELLQRNTRIVTPSDQQRQKQKQAASASAPSTQQQQQHDEFLDDTLDDDEADQLGEEDDDD